MKDTALGLARAITGSARDLAPILLVVLFFQLAVLRQPLPNLVETGVGVAKGHLNRGRRPTPPQRPRHLAELSSPSLAESAAVLRSI